MHVAEGAAGMMLAAGGMRPMIQVEGDHSLAVGTCIHNALLPERRGTVVAAGAVARAAGAARAMSRSHSGFPFPKEL